MTVFCKSGELVAHITQTGTRSLHRSRAGQVLQFYGERRSHWEYAFVYFRFYQGTGPSEAVALKWGGVDLLSGKATFTVSRHLGEENAPKTRASPQNGDATIQGTLRVLEIRPRPFYNTRHTYISIALTLGCNQKDRGVNRNQHCDDSGNYGKYIRDDGDLLLRAYR